MTQVSAVILWKQGHFVGKCQTPTILNSALFKDGTPRAAWLSSTSYCCGGDEAYKVLYSKPANDPNALSGVAVTQDDQFYVVDGTLSDFLTKSNGCCGDNAVVTPVYAGTFPALITPLAKTYTITRADNNDLQASDRFMVDYMKWIIDGTYLKTAWDGTNSTYVFQSYSDPIQQGSDTVVETPRAFDSNAAPTLTGSNVFRVSGVADGAAYDYKGTTALASTVTALNADAVMKLYGTWSVVSTHIHLVTTTYDSVTIVLGQEAP